MGRSDSHFSAMLKQNFKYGLLYYGLTVTSLHMTCYLDVHIWSVGVPILHGPHEVFSTTILEEGNAVLLSLPILYLKLYVMHYCCLSLS